MYLEYWQLAAKPFEAGCESAFLYRSEGRQAAIHKLRYAIEGGRGAALLAGAAGVGKTLLIESLRSQLPAKFQPITSVNFPQMTDRDLLTYLAEKLGAPPAASPRHTVEESLRRIEFVLGENANQGRHPVVVVDESHLLDDAGLTETMRLLLNLAPGGRPTFTLLLCGQLKLLSDVQRYGSLDQRLDIKAVLPPLSAEESAAYIQHRLNAAGAAREIFSADALTAAHSLSGGVPRRLNRLCDLALLVGFANEEHTITADQLYSVEEELISTITNLSKAA